MGGEEKGYNRRTGRLLVDVAPRFFRSAEVELISGDTSKAREFGWKGKVPFPELVRMMIRAYINKYVEQG